MTNSKNLCRFVGEPSGNSKLCHFKEIDGQLAGKDVPSPNVDTSLKKQQ